MAIREHEAIAIRPDGMLRIELHHAIPNYIHQRRKRHRRPGMPGVRLLHSIDRERSNSVDAQLVHFRRRSADALAA